MLSVIPETLRSPYKYVVPLHQLKSCNTIGLRKRVIHSDLVFNISNDVIIHVNRHGAIEWRNAVLLGRRFILNALIQVEELTGMQFSEHGRFVKAKLPKCRVDQTRGECSSVAVVLLYTGLQPGCVSAGEITYTVRGVSLQRVEVRAAS